MKIELELPRATEMTSDGYPLVFEFRTKETQTKKNRILFAATFSDDAKAITLRHPNHDILQPRIMELQLKSREIVLRGVTSVKQLFCFIFI